MKRFFFLFLAINLTSHVALTGQSLPAFNQSSQSSVALPNALLTPDMKKLLDSVHRSDWDDQGSSWILTQKQYKLKDNAGKLVQDQYLAFDTGSGQWIVTRRFLYEYFTGSPDVSSYTGQLLNTETSSFETYEYTHYTSPNKADEIYTKIWDQQLHEFSGGSRTLYQFNAQGMTTEMLQQVLDTASQDWIPGTRNTYSYDTSQNLSSNLMESWNKVSQKYVNAYLWGYAYDSYEFLTGLLEFSWDADSSEWVNVSRTTYTNNGFGDPITIVFENWNPADSNWILVSMYTNSYSPQGYKLNQLLQLYDYGTQEWKNYYLTYWTYYATGNDKARTGKFWNANLSQWIQNSYLTYDSLGHETEEYSKDYNPQTYEFTGGYRYSFEYDAGGNRILYMVQNWNTGLNDWNNVARDQYTYETGNLLKEDLYQQWSLLLADWVNATKWEYFYNEFIGIVDPPRKQPVCLFENPLRTGSAIRCPFLADGNLYGISLFTLSGSQVFRTGVSGTGTFSIGRELPEGMYLLRISRDEQTVYEGKVILVR